ncbi:4-demethylwyosine synthase TYW1 [Candidatus Bathyarchaeota archaeon]|nr:4-demethylwyosine synthase TYW1 [Candidatus Bathyarchaeota archaeon]
MKLPSRHCKRPSKLRPVTASRYLRAGYRLVGTHSGIQICRWTRAALTGRRLCYKRWYGVQSHRCLQLTPSLQFCNMRCVFCWRFHTSDRFKAEHDWDTPNLILDEAIAAQQKLLSGFKANPHVTRKKYEESMNPAHVAVSLDGEPTLYPLIGDLIQEIHRRGMTSFLVTNGTMPERLEGILERQIEPTNLYLSVYGPDKQTYERVTHPSIPDAWKRVTDSLRLMPRFKYSRTIARLTLVKGQNMHKPEQYSKLVMEGSPSIIELKGYSWLGESKQRLPISAMPYQSEIKEFAKEMAKATGYELIAEDTVSRVIALAREGSTTGLSLDAC